MSSIWHLAINKSSLAATLCHKIHNTYQIPHENETRHDVLRDNEWK